MKFGHKSSIVSFSITTKSPPTLDWIRWMDRGEHIPGSIFLFSIFGTDKPTNYGEFPSPPQKDDARSIGWVETVGETDMEIVGPWLSPVSIEVSGEAATCCPSMASLSATGTWALGIWHTMGAGSMAGRWVGRSWQKFQREEDLEIQFCYNLTSSRCCWCLFRCFFVAEPVAPRNPKARRHWLRAVAVAWFHT